MKTSCTTLLLVCLAAWMWNPRSSLAHDDGDAFTTSTNKLWAVNLATGAESLIGTAFGANWLSGLSFDPLTGDLYAVEEDAIVILDPTDGHVVWSGNHGLQLLDTPSGLAFDNVGNLFLLHDSSFYSINRLTGHATLLGVNALNNGGSLANSPDGNLFAIGEHDDFNGLHGLVRLDPTDGSVLETIGPLVDPSEPGPFTGGMGSDFDSRGVLYMCNSNRNSLYTVSLDTAVVIAVGDLAVTFGSLAIYRDCNGNSVFDDQDVASGSSSDQDGNGIPDECAFCGDGNCDFDEDQCSCAADCGSPPSLETACEDGADDDCDQFIDCADDDCDDAPACAPPLTPGGPGDLLLTARTTDRVERIDGVTGQFLVMFPTGPTLVAPTGLVIGPDGQLYVAGQNSRNVVRYNLATGTSVDTFVQPEAGGLFSPWGITFGPDGNLYVVDGGMFSNSRNTVRRYHGTSGEYIDDFVAQGDGGLIQPTDLVFGPDGNLYVTSTESHSVLRYNGITGDFMDVFVSSGSGGLVRPTGICFGPDGHLYASSFDSLGAVYKYDGTLGDSLGLFVPPGSGGLGYPYGLAFGPDGRLYVTSEENNIVLRYDGTDGTFHEGFVYGPFLSNPRYIAFQPPDCTRDSECDDGNPISHDVCYTYACRHLATARIYVDSDAIGNNDGSSWTDAYIELQDALDTAAAQGGPVEVWVAEGTYAPDRGTGDRAATFQLLDGMTLYGGFAGVETSLDERDVVSHITTLTGDLDGNDDPAAGPGPGSDCCSASPGLGCDDSTCEAAVCAQEPSCCTDGWNVGCGQQAQRLCCGLCTTLNVTTCENSLHVVTGSGAGLDAPSVLDGFTITAGNATGPEFKAPQDRGGGLLIMGGSPEIRNCTFIANAATLGGAVHAEDFSRPVLISNSFLGNVSQTGGGGMGVHSTSDAVLTNCAFSGNVALLGGGIYVFNSRPTLTNCSMIANEAADAGGGIFNAEGVTAITNSILWENSDSGGMGESAQFVGADWDINYCCVQGWTGSFGGVGNTGDCEPFFVDADGQDDVPGTADDNLQLLAGSANIDVANNDADTNALQAGLQSLPGTDLIGNPRVVNRTVDRGAYEYKPCPADLNGDFVTNAADLALLLGAWGPNPGHAADLNMDGQINAADLALLLGSWGPC